MRHATIDRETGIWSVWCSDITRELVCPYSRRPETDRAVRAMGFGGKNSRSYWRMVATNDDLEAGLERRVGGNRKLGRWPSVIGHSPPTLIGRRRPLNDAESKLTVAPTVALTESLNLHSRYS